MMEFKQGQPVNLWSGKAPLAHGDEPEDIPTITPYFPYVWKNTGKAVIVLPGGGYWGLADHEGSEYGKWLAQNGYTAFVVKYRLGANSYRHPAEISDAARAIRVVRTHAGELGIDPHKIGIMGSSAGGHLAASCATLHELGLREEGESTEKDLGRPDFAILCYPVISGVEPWSHFGSFDNLLGAGHSKELAQALSMEKAADKNTPPVFIWHTWQDQCVPVENSLMYAMRLKECGVPCDLHVYEVGPHGMGLAGGHPWTEECLRWLARI